MDSLKFPLFEGAEYAEGFLGPGECLYIPVLSVRDGIDCRGDGGIS